MTDQPRPLPEWDDATESFDVDRTDPDDLEPDYDEAEAHDRWHRWYHAGCTDCDLRADWIEAGRP